MVSVLITGCKKFDSRATAIVPSPEFQVHLYFKLFEGKPFYLVYYNDDVLIDWSALGLQPENGPDLSQNLKLIAKENGSGHSGDSNKHWMDVLAGKAYNSLELDLRSEIDSQVGYNIIFRTFDHGIAFRYELNEVPDDMRISNNSECSEIDLNDDYSWNILSKNDSVGDGVYELPAILNSENGHEVQIDEIITNPFPGMKLKRRSDINHEYIVTSEKNDTESDVSALTTPWRIILFNKK